ncbi:MAG: hypothetical protein KGK44_11375 [Gammaproteobacteria bacterium]|nr:hypothetical protein [Gammaproteobacteria bacterium]
MHTNYRIIPIIAIIELVLILPAGLFLIAVLVRHTGPLAYPAQQIVIWYATRFWTLWVLMITLPLVALLFGGVTLFMCLNAQTVEQQSARQQFAAILKSVPLLVIAISTLAAGIILVIVALHVLAN